MGLFHVQIEILPVNGGASTVQSVLVDTGASYLVLPGSLLVSLGYRAVDRQRVIFATGQAASWEIAEVRVRLQGRERTVLAFLAPDQSPMLLGAQTLETFGLGVDPLGKRLIPVDAYLAQSRDPTVKHLKPERELYLMDAQPDIRPALTVTPGEVLVVEVAEGFLGIRDPARLPTPFTDEAVGHPIGKVTGPIFVEGALPGDSLRVDLLAIDPGDEGVTVILKNYGWLPKEFPGPVMRVSPIRDGFVHFGGLRIPVRPSLGTLATMPEELDHFGYAGPHGGDLDQNELRAGTVCHLPVFRPGGLLFLADPHAIIGDGITCGTGLECGATVTLRVTVERPARLDRPVIETADAVQVVGTGPSLDEACRDAARAAVRLIAGTTRLSAEDAYVLCSLVGDFKIGTSPRPVMAVRIVLPKGVLSQAAR